MSIKQSEFSTKLMNFCKMEIKKQNITKAEISRKCGVDPHTIDSWLRGNTVPSVSNTSQLLNVLGYEFAVRRKP